MKGLYGRPEIDEVRWELQQFRDEGRNPFAFEAPKCGELMFGPRMQELAAVLLGGNPMTFADYQINACDFWSPFSYHKDNIDRFDKGGPDWGIAPFPMVRFGIYLEDYRERSGPLAVQPFSHHGPVFDLPGENVCSEPGDVVVWYFTTTHSANSPSVRWAPGWAPRVMGKARLVRSLEQRLIRTLDRPPLTLPRAPTRQVLFFAYALRSPALCRYVSYLMHRQYFHDFIERDPSHGGHPRTPGLGRRSWLDVGQFRSGVHDELVVDDFNQRAATKAAAVLCDAVEASLNTATDEPWSQAAPVDRGGR